MSQIYLKVPQISKSLLTRTFKQCLRKKFQACCSTSSANENTQTFSISNTNPGFLEGKFMATDKFGKLNIDVPFDIHIESLNPDKYPEMNKMFVKLFYVLQPDEKVDSSVLVALRQCYTFSMNFQDKKEFTAKGHFNSKVEYPVKCVVQLPMKFDLDVTARGCRTTIEKMESERITVKAKSERAASTQSVCTLKNVKCGTVEVQGTDCDVTSEKLLQGNSKIILKGQGNITTERLLGLTIQCQTENGGISATSVYGENNSFHSNTGNISLSNCHGKTEVKVNSGDLKIDGLEGDFNGTVNEGNSDLYITKPENIAMTTNKGNIALKVQGEVNASFDLNGSKVTYDTSLSFNELKFSEDDPRSFKGSLGEGGGNISATTASGSINVESFDWLKSLNLKSGE
ncbi:protein FAM185A-like [Saccostrea cucullata]|uniref:protein FAM185A-like n=1 Tax=Saccostrea cuccullata TaxID=36930 RepID=UPI002ED0A29C